MERGNTSLGADPDTGLAAGPLILRSLFDEESRKAILRFMDERVPLLPVSRDESTFVRTYAHNVSFFIAIHKQLAATASEIFGEEVKPSYSFLSMYQNDGICPLHIDRPQCRYTIDYLIRQTQPEPWPILIGDHMTDEQRQIHEETGDGNPQTEGEIQARIAAENWHRIELSPNDAVCYSGTHSWHYRPDRLRGTADLVFFHFVPVGFDGPLN
jgi:hypothetical protein